MERLRLRPSLLVLVVLAATLANGCMGESSGVVGDLLGPGGAGGGGGPGVSADLPCEAANVLVASCTGCHSSPPTGGAPQALNSLAALQAASTSQPGKSNGQLSVERMASTTSPMPPSPNPAVPVADQSAFAAWVAAGMPAGTCSNVVDAGTPVQDPAFTAAPTCTSGSYWTQGDHGSANMHPGLACISCHAGGDGPTFAVAGTVYPTGHEYDDCNGSGASGAQVTVTDRSGVSRSFAVGSAGNFSGKASGGWPVFPITASVSFQGRTRAMITPVPLGDCDVCHGQAGTNNAPGRIALP